LCSKVAATRDTWGGNGAIPSTCSDLCFCWVDPLWRMRPLISSSVSASAFLASTTVAVPTGPFACAATTICWEPVPTWLRSMRVFLPADQHAVPWIRRTNPANPNAMSTFTTPNLYGRTTNIIGLEEVRAVVAFNEPGAPSVPPMAAARRHLLGPERRPAQLNGARCSPSPTRGAGLS
jgi:hypothetical protein